MLIYILLSVTVSIFNIFTLDIFTLDDITLYKLYTTSRKNH